MPSPTTDSVSVRNGVTVADLCWFGFGVAVVALAVWGLVTDDGEVTTYRDTRVGMDSRMPVALGIVVFAVLALIWPVIRAVGVASRPTMAVVDATGVRLFKAGAGVFRSSTPTVTAAWTDIDRIVLWHWRPPSRWWFPRRRLRLGLELSGDYYTVTRRRPTEQQSASRAVRRSGVPVRLGVMMPSRSVAATPRQFRAVAAAVARYSPTTVVVDDRRPHRD